MAQRKTSTARQPVPARAGAPSPPSTPLLKPWMAAAAAATLHLLLCAAAFDPGPYPGGDNGAYVSLARGLLETGRYLDYWDPARPAHTQYPPVFPLILAGAMGLGVSVWVGVKWVCLLFSAAAVGLAALWLQRVLPRRTALVVALLVAVVPSPLGLANQVLSDVPFWTWTMLALWAYARAEAGDASWKWEALGAAALILAFFTRSAGLPLAVAAGGWLLMRRHWRSLAILGGSLGPLALGWWLRTRALGSESAYAREFWWVHPYAPERGTIGPLTFLQRILQNVVSYGTDRLPAFFFGEEAIGRPWAAAMVTALVLIAAVGWGMRVRRPGVAELFLPLYVGLLLAWPATWSGERFILPILPPLFAYAAIALRAAVDRLPAAWLVPPLAAAGLTLAMVPGIQAQLMLGEMCRSGYRAGEAAPCMPAMWSDLLNSAALSRGRLPPGSVVIHRKPTLYFVGSGYPAAIYPKSEDPDTFFALVRRTGADYVVIDQISDMSGYLHGVIRARPHQFCIVRELSSPNAAFARIVERAPPLAPGRRDDSFRTCPASGPPFTAAQLQRASP